jgi:hypothetical protein
MSAIVAQLEAEGTRKCAAFEQHYSPDELGQIWGLSADFLRGVFEREPGVVIFENSKAGKRRYRTMRIPASVATRVHRRLTVLNR